MNHHTFPTNSADRQSGMSLVGVLVALGLAGVLALGMSTIFKQSFNAQQHVSQMASQSNISQLVHTLIGNDKSCLATFGKPFKPERPGKQKISLSNSAGTPILQAEGKGSNNSNVKFKGIQINSIEATSAKTDDYAFQVTLEIKTTRIGDGNLSKHNRKATETFLVNIMTDDKFNVVSCGSNNDPYKIVNIENGSIKIPGGKSSYSMYNPVLNPAYGNGGSWEAKMEHRACLSETTGKQIRACTYKVFDQIIDIKAKGNMFDISLSGLLTATGAGQSTILEAHLRDTTTNKCIKTIVHAVQTGGGIRDMQTSNGSNRMIVNNIVPDRKYRLKFKFNAPRYRDLAAMISPAANRLHDPRCGGNYAGHINQNGNPYTNSFYCPIYSTYWGGKYSVVEYMTTGKSAKTTWGKCEI